METKTLTFRKAAASDLDAVTAIYDRLHAQEDAGRVTIGWVTGVYPIRFDAEQALARGDLYVCESEGRVAASGILNQRQVDVYTEGRWAYAAEDRDVFVLHTLTVDPDLSGRGIGCISWDGSVHADQFWREHTFGNVLERPFSAIWDDPSIELLHKLKDKKRHVTGRCATCRFLSICGGNFRARAESVHGDLWAPDPACYLSDAEIKG